MSHDPQFDPNDAIRRVRSGDTNAFRGLIDQYHRLVLGYFAGAISDDATVQELTQDSFVTAYEKLHQYRGEGFPAWLMSIARSKLLMWLRSKQRRQSAMDRLRAEIVVLTDEHEQRFEKEETTHQIEKLRTCMDQLPDSVSQVLRTCYLEGASIRDLASELNRSEDAVRSMLFRARERLRQCMVASS